MAEIAKIKTIDGTEYDIKDTIARTNYVAKNGDTMTGVLVAANYVTKYGIEFQNSSGTNVGGVFQDTSGGNQVYIDEYTSGGVRECYLLPTPNASTASFYDILTSKNAVTVAQGGTGATTAAGARSNLGLGSMATASTGDYVAKAGDTMTGVLRAPCYFSTDNGSTGYNGLSFTSGTNVVKARVHYKQEANVSSHLVFGQDSVDGTKYASFHLPEITANEDYNIITTANAIISGFKTAQAGGYEIDQWGNFKHTSSTESNSFCIDSNAGAHNFKYTFETGALELAGNLTVAGYIVGANGVYATNGTLVSRANTPQLHFQNASGQDMGGMFASSNRVYVRQRPSAGSSYVTDVVFPAAKSNGNENVYVYTSRNFSLSGTTLTITVPS